MAETNQAGQPLSCPEINADDVRVVRDCMLDSPTARRLSNVFRALSDPTRLRIISALEEREFCVGDLAAALEMEQSAVSHQLSDMREMHLVRFRKEGRHVYYQLDDEHVRHLFAEGLAHVSHA